MASRTKKKPVADLASQADAKAPLDWQRFLALAQPVMKLLRADLRARAQNSPGVSEGLKARHASERDAKRTGDSFVDWQDHFIQQVAASWLLSCVFVRTLEDRGLLGHNRLAGEGASDSLKLFLEFAPSLNERDYLLTVFRELTRFPSTTELFDERHNPVWLLAPSAEAAKALLQLFQRPRADAPAFRFGQSDTGFLGWIYQDLDEDVRERFALLQTPRFVESFILDRTLEPAIEKFGLDDTTLIDPTCGSGHFLLGAFDRLFDHRLRKEPGLSPRDAARKALDAVHGADINPYAVGIARFRMTLAFLDKAGFSSLRTAPTLPLHIVVADSLLHNPHVRQGDLADLAPTSKNWRGEEFALEDESAARAVLHRKYTAVVGNPPYITVKDAVLRARYAEMYRTCRMNYALTVPFMELFFQIAKDGGRVGMITSNSFIKREFGKLLIEKFLPTVNLELVINTAGAHIPGHGTPTVLLFGSAETPQGMQIATVLGTRGEPSTPADPSKGLVWRGIEDHWSETGFENEFISVTKTERSSLAKHPWSLGGGGAADLKELLEECAERRLSDVVSDVGFSIIIGEDDVFIRRANTGLKRSIPTIPFVTGENVRDWSLTTPEEILSPFEPDTWVVTPTPALTKELWPWRVVLERRIVSGSTSMKEARRIWFDVRRLSRDKHAAPRSITFAFVATHNHFVFDRGGKVFNRSAPIIKLPDAATDDDHFALLAYLNSSTACFWMKQVFFDKGNRGEGGGTTAERWEKFYEHDGTKLHQLPIPRCTQTQWRELGELGRTLSSSASKRQQLLHVDALFRSAPDPDSMRDALRTRESDIARLEDQIRSVQETLDWYVYELFGLAKGLEAPRRELLPPAARASDVLFAREVSRGEVGLRYFELCRLPVPKDCTNDAWVREHDLARSIDAVTSSKNLTLLESPVFKRTYREGFRPPNWRAAGEQFLAEIAEERLCSATAVVAAREVRVALALSLAKVVPAVCRDSEEIAVAQLLVENSAPFLAALRFSGSGLDRYDLWLHTWDIQRREDAGETPDNVQVPPKYGQGDYRSAALWQLRGPLDVPNERFISYPGCESDQDREQVYGSARWDHEQRARALATLYWNRRDEEAWSKDRLTPMLAGLLELLPWLKQWHNEKSNEYAGVSPATYYEGFLDDECRKQGLTRDDLRAWRPAEKKRAAALPAKQTIEKGAWRLPETLSLDTAAYFAVAAAALIHEAFTWRVLAAAQLALGGKSALSFLRGADAKTWKQNLGDDHKGNLDGPTLAAAHRKALDELKRAGVLIERADGILAATGTLALDAVRPTVLVDRLRFVLDHVMPKIESEAQVLPLFSPKPAKAKNAQRKAV